MRLEATAMTYEPGKYKPIEQKRLTKKSAYLKKLERAQKPKLVKSVRRSTVIPFHSQR